MRFIHSLLIGLLVLSNLAFSQMTQKQIDEFFTKFNSADRSRITGLFSKHFLDAVPEAQLVKILDLFRDKYGNFERAVHKGGPKIEVLYEKATMPGTINFDDDGKIAGLWFGSPVMKEDSYEKIKEELKALNGIISICIRKNGNEFLSVNKNQSLAVGSTFKLFVLKTLVNNVKSGKMKWDDVARLNSKFKSIPSGMLQNWPDNEPVTLSTLANMMISISDNTATDNLIGLLGSENIEKNSPESMKPFYMTNEIFRLKLGKDSAEINKYNKMDLVNKRKELQTISILPVDSLDASKFVKPIHIEIEWLVSTEELCKVIESLKGVKALSINSGLAEKERWNYVAFKGGSEPGVLNYTHLIQKSKDSDMYSISATINNPDDNVDKEKEFTTLVLRLIGLISKEK